MSLIWNPEEAATIVEMPLEVITTGTQNMGNGIYWLKAGTPLDEYFAVSNDDDAKYIVAEDFKFISTKPDQAKIVPLITAGYVDLDKAKAASGLTYTEDCIAALETAGIVMVDGTISGGGTSVEANPTLAGTEDSLTGIQIGETKYAVGGSSGGGVLVVHRSLVGTPPAFTLDKTWQEIFDAASTGAAFIADVEEEEVGTKLVTTVYVDSGVYYCEDSSELVYSTDSADGYPASA